MDLPINYNTTHYTIRKQARNEYIKLQKGLCCYCHSSLNTPPPIDILEKRLNLDLFPPNFLQWPIHLHHCHKTGMTIGAVHNYCNGILWQYHGE